MLEDFYARSVSAMDQSENLLSGRPYGGLAILWRKNIENLCKIVTYDDNRIMGITINDTHYQSLILNVYLPYYNGANINEYHFYLGKIDHIVDVFPSPSVFVCGDFNANISCNKHLFGKELVRFCEESGLILSDQLILGASSGSYTYCSDAHHIDAWLDHIVSTTTAHKAIKSIAVDTGFITSDHFPLNFVLHFNDTGLNDQAAQDQGQLTSNRYKIKWDNVSQVEIAEYKVKSDHKLSKIKMDHSLLLCDNSNCKDIGHTSSIDNLYKRIIESLLEASDELASTVKEFSQVLGWNDVCKESHSLAREAYIAWISSNKPRQGPLHDRMKKLKAQFKLILKQCKKDLDIHNVDSLAKKLISKDPKEFWTEVKKQSGKCSTNVAASIDGASCITDVTKMWHNYFSKLLNSSTDLSRQDYVISEFAKINSSEFPFESVCTPLMISKCIGKLKKGKAAGKDYIASEHFIYCTSRICVLL